MSYTKGRKIYIAFSVLAEILVLIIIFMLSAQNGEQSSSTSGFFTQLIALLAGCSIPESIIRTLAHFCDFAGLGFLTCNLIFAIKGSLKPLHSILFAFGYAITDEVHQIFVPERAFQLTDLAVDFGGIALGVAAFSIIALLVKRYKKSH